MVAKVPRRIGGAQAREEFWTLIDEIARGAGAVEITDHDKVKAVLISKREYAWLSACAKQNASQKRSPRGLIALADDQALNDATKQLRADFENSIRNTVSE